MNHDEQQATPDQTASATAPDEDSTAYEPETVDGGPTPSGRDLDNRAIESFTFGPDPEPVFPEGGPGSVGTKVTGPRAVVSGEKSFLTDPTVMTKLNAAAEAAGMTPEQLVNFIADSGLLALPPSDGTTHSYTLRDLGATLWTSMQKRSVTERRAWFHKLVPNQQKAVVVHLRHFGFSTMTVANELDFPLHRVREIWSQFADDAGAQVVGTRLNTIAGNLQLVYESAMEGLAQTGDHAGRWKMAKELAQAWQSLGIVERAVQKIEVTHKDGSIEEKSAALKKLLELEQKKQRRMEEIKQIEANVYEPEPEVFSGQEEQW